MFKNSGDLGPDEGFPLPVFVLGGGRFRHRFGRGFGRAASRAGQRGNMKYEILSVLADEPRHGYDIMLEIEKRRGFRPSPGSIYPALQMLEDGGFIAGKDVGGKRVFEVTQTGLEQLAEFTEKGGFERDADDDSLRLLFGRGAAVLRGLIGAAKQAARSGNPRAIERTLEVLDRARREIYSILADET
jgi:DNA-binding PadR family transcriptional regulator